MSAPNQVHWPHTTSPKTKNPGVNVFSCVQPCRLAASLALPTNGTDSLSPEALQEYLSREDTPTTACRCSGHSGVLDLGDRLASDMSRLDLLIHFWGLLRSGGAKEAFHLFVPPQYWFEHGDCEGALHKVGVCVCDNPHDWKTLNKDLNHLLLRSLIIFTASPRTAA
jgi:hypothetical protein